MDCIFCKIIAGEIPSDKVYEDESVLAFRDINPQAPVHVLIVPKKHMRNILECDDATATAVLKAIGEVARQEGVSVSGFRVVTNCGRDGAQSVCLLYTSDVYKRQYLDQPHTSAGRVPSYKAYRLYVDKLLKAGQLSREERQKIAQHMETRSKQVETVIRRAARVLSDATKYTSVIVAPHIGSLRIRHVQIVPVSSGTAMLIIVTSAGIVKDAIIHIPEGLSADHLYGISRMLTEQLAGQPIESVRQIFAEIIRGMGNERKLLAETMQVIEENIAAVDDREVYVGGSGNRCV